MLPGLSFYVSEGSLWLIQVFVVFLVNKHQASAPESLPSQPLIFHMRVVGMGLNERCVLVVAPLKFV